MPQYHPLRFLKRDSLTRGFRFSTRTGEVSTPFDFTGSVIRFRAAWHGGLIEKTSPGGIDVTGNTITLTLTEAERIALPAAVAITYAIEREIGAGNNLERTTLLYGHINAEAWA